MSWTKGQPETTTSLPYLLGQKEIKPNKTCLYCKKIFPYEPHQIFCSKSCLRKKNTKKRNILRSKTYNL